MELSTIMLNIDLFFFFKKKREKRKKKNKGKTLFRPEEDSVIRDSLSCLGSLRTALTSINCRKERLPRTRYYTREI